MSKLNPWFLTLCVLFAAFVVYQGVEFMFATDDAREPEVAAARSCNISLNPVQALNFGALVRPSNGRAAISIDTVGDLVVDHDHSVGINQERYAPSSGKINLHGRGLSVGEQFEVRFIVGETSNDMSIENFVFRLENVSNLQELEIDADPNTVEFKALGSDVHASLSYGATLTVGRTVSGSVTPSLIIEINGDRPCRS